MDHQIVNSIAREDDGTVQVTFTFPKELIKKSQEKALKEFSKDITVKGFRKGMAPVEKSKEHVAVEKVIRAVITDLLPSSLGKAFEEHKIQAMMYPKIEAVSVEDGQDWQIRAVTCELPAFDTGNYKEAIKNLGKSLKKEKTELTSEEKQKKLVDLLEKTISVKIPHILIEEEVEGRLSTLLDRIDKLGLSLESYLASLGKTPEKLREEYIEESKNTIAIELILEKIAKEEKIEVTDEQIDEVLKIGEADKALSEKLNSPEQRSVVRSILKKRKCLDALTALL